MMPCQVKISTDSWDKLLDLQRVYDLDIHRTTAQKTQRGFEVQGLHSQDQIDRLRKDGYGIKVEKDAEEMEEMARQRQKEVSGHRYLM